MSAHNCTCGHPRSGHDRLTGICLCGPMGDWCKCNQFTPAADKPEPNDSSDAAATPLATQIKKAVKNPTLENIRGVAYVASSNLSEAENALLTERAKSEQAFALVDEYESALHAKDKENTQLQATVARLEAHVKDLEQRQEVIRDYVPQTAGDVVMAKWPLPPFEGHEWDNRTSEENAVWCLGEFRDIIARLEGELAEAKQKATNLKTLSVNIDRALGEVFQERDSLHAQLAAEKAAHDQTKHDLEAAKRERDEAREQADTVRGALIQQCLRAGMTVCTTEDATNLVEMLGTTLAEAQRREFERDEHDEQKQELGLRLLADRDSLCAQVEQLTADRDALAAQVEAAKRELTEARSK